MAFLVPKGERVDFEAITEGWSTYKVKDKAPVTLKARIVVVKVVRTTEFNDVGDPVYATATGDVMLGTFAPPEIRGSPTVPPPTKEQIADSVVADLPFEVVGEPWNEYKLKDGTIVRVKIIVTGVMSTPFYGIDGDPVYYVNYQRVSRIVVPPEMRKTRQKSNVTNQEIA